MSRKNFSALLPAGVIATSFVTCVLWTALTGAWVHWLAFGGALLVTGLLFRATSPKKKGKS